MIDHCSSSCVETLTDNQVHYRELGEPNRTPDEPSTIIGLTSIGVNASHVSREVYSARLNPHSSSHNVRFIHRLCDDKFKLDTSI